MPFRDGLDDDIPRVFSCGHTGTNDDGEHCRECFKEFCVQCIDGDGRCWCCATKVEQGILVKGDAL